MNGIGLDCGYSTVKLVMVSQEGRPVWFKSSSHHGDAARTVRLLLGELLQSDTGYLHGSGIVPAELGRCRWKSGGFSPR